MATQKQDKSDALKPVEEAVNAGKEQVEKAVEAGHEAASKQYEQVVNQTKEQIDQGSRAMFKGYEEIATLNKAHIEAVVQASTIATKGMESLSREMMNFAQQQLESNVATTKKLFGATTVREVFDLQSELARETFDKLMAESAKMTEMSVKVANEALQPIQTQTSAAVEKATKPAA